jgi:hypothetical protein
VVDAPKYLPANHTEKIWMAPNRICVLSGVMYAEFEAHLLFQVRINLIFRYQKRMVMMVGCQACQYQDGFSFLSMLKFCRHQRNFRLA